MSARGSLLLVLGLAGCLAQERRDVDTDPVMSRDGKLAVAIERYVCRCGEGPHLAAVVRARRARGTARGTTAWVNTIDGGSEDVVQPQCVDCRVEVAIEREVVVVRTCGPDRRYRLATGARLE